ncbi:hypothetical protein CC1G_15430 [Coprinopsis cinerea okayama7|uniref:Uncharacterized protein n=1 Tax=Coprinopsis cinerea (strain Okayama-7 / 130 / ATCC MYA-4618 / FGSC 9003) TaxID=240176 RepID=D6RQN3_COPC7|nr:hypothetical protein CC1G_15430 [Coprinopsis cinerea okayama7\|eukprot:XP_002910153.1 hypothetical protein CC1G_15430 [Coprinopsis cinerea okayama7\
MEWSEDGGLGTGGSRLSAGEPVDTEVEDDWDGMVELDTGVSKLYGDDGALVVLLQSVAGVEARWDAAAGVFG